MNNTAAALLVLAVAVLLVGAVGIDAFETRVQFISGGGVVLFDPLETSFTVCKLRAGYNGVTRSGIAECYHDATVWDKAYPSTW